MTAMLECPSRAEMVVTGVPGEYGPVVLTRLMGECRSAPGAGVYGLAVALISLAVAVSASALARLAGMPREPTAVVFIVVLVAVAIGAATADGPLLDRVRGRQHEALRRR